MRILVVGIEEHGQLRAGSDAELRVDVREMALDRSDAHEQRRRDLAIGATGAGEPRDSLLDRRQLSYPTAATDPVDLCLRPRDPQPSAQALEDRDGFLQYLPRGLLLFAAAADGTDDHLRSPE